MKVQMWKTERVKPYGNNPRMNDSAVQAVAKSIEEFGFRQPIVVDKEGVIVVGHTRWKAASKLGLKTVPVHNEPDPIARRDVAPDTDGTRRSPGTRQSLKRERNMQLGVCGEAERGQTTWR